MSIYVEITGTFSYSANFSGLEDTPENREYCKKQLLSEIDSSEMDGDCLSMDIEGIEVYEGEG